MSPVLLIMLFVVRNPLTGTEGPGSDESPSCVREHPVANVVIISHI